MAECGVYFPSFMGSPRDVTGCLLPDRHSGRHECLTDSGKRIEWESDMDCPCFTDSDPADWCVLWRDAARATTGANGNG